MAATITKLQVTENVENSAAFLESRLQQMAESGLIARGDREHLGAVIQRAAAMIVSDNQVRGRRLTAQRADAFLLALGSGLSVSASAALAGVARRTLYDMRARDEEFARRWDDALDMSVNVIEERFSEIAMTGDPGSMATVRAGEALLRGRSRGHRRDTSGSVEMRHRDAQGRERVLVIEMNTPLPD
jgi:hypothetical protein